MRQVDETESEKLLYNFLTKPDNFIMMNEMANHCKPIIDKTINSFWIELRDKLVAHLELKTSAWVCDFSDSFGHGVNKLWMYKSNWLNNRNVPSIAIGFEELNYGQVPFIGIFIDNGARNELDIRQITELCHSLHINSLQNSEGTWWPKHKNLSFSLQTYKNLQDILPDSEGREAAIKSAFNEALLIIDVLEQNSEAIEASIAKIRSPSE